MADVYNVSSHTEQAVTLKKAGVHLFGPSTLVIPRAQIASVKTVLGRIIVSTTAGQTYKVQMGIRNEQRELTRAAFGL